MQKRNFIIIIVLIFSSKISAQTNQSCATATPLILNAPCLAQHLPDSLQNANPNACVDSLSGALWYEWQASFSGILLIETNAKFNDMVSVFGGDCNNLSLIECTNRDEYGFDGEQLYLTVSEGVNYWMEVSGVKDRFGIRNDSFCIQISQAAAIPTPPINDLCENAPTLILGQNCVTQTNQHANIEGVLPSDTERARADIWWQFEATQSELIILTNADFSNIIGVFEGDCDNLTEIKTSRSGSFLLNNLTIGNTYFVQVTGNFATIEGNICIEIQFPESATNEDCPDAIPVTLNDGCLEFSNYDRTMSAIFPSCEFNPAADIWFTFTAPASHGIKFNTQADFLNAVAIYEGDCDNLKEVFCKSNPQSCSGYTTVENLMSGQTYFMQIMSKGTTFGHLEGMGCLEILDIEQGDNFVPLTLEVETFCQSVEEAQIIVSASGGIGNYIFSGNENGEILANGSNYIVQVKDDQGCVQVKNGTINCSTPAECGLFYFLQTESVSCAGNADGAATISISGSDNPTFEWSNGATGTTAMNLSAGFHYVTVTSSDSCFFSLEVTIPSPLSLNANATIIGTGHETFEDGSITLLPFGGTPPYTYEWENGTSNSVLENLPTGDYAFTITDNNGCQFLSSATVEVAPLCPESRILSNDIPANTMETYAAADFIHSTSNIAVQADVQYKAGNQIRLQTGFRVLEGGRFEGIIEECDPIIIDKTNDNSLINQHIEAYPNPFTKNVFLEFELNTTQPITIELLTPNGQLVRQILTKQELKAGFQQIKIDGTGLISGVYFVSVTGTNFRETVKVNLIKN